MPKAREIRERQARLRTASPATAVPRQQDPRTFRAATPLLFVVIRSTQAQVQALPANGAIQVQQVRYADTPPVAQQLEGVGPWRSAYPYPGLRPQNFGAYAWGPDDPISAGVSVLLAIEERGSIVLIKPLCPAGTVLDPNQAVSGCNFG